MRYVYDKLDKSFANLVRDKTVAVVGPAPYTANVNLVDEIESRDLVVRINRGFPVIEEMKSHVGSRTDIHYTVGPWVARNFVDYIADLEKKPLKFITLTYPRKLKPNEHLFKKKLDSMCIGYKKVSNLDFANFIGVLKARPSTGNMAILDLLAYPIKELYICGITFYMDGFYYEKYGNPRTGKTLKRHQPDIQRVPMLQAFQDPRVAIEPTMRKIILGE